MAVNAGIDTVEEVCPASRDPEMSEEGNPKVSKFHGTNMLYMFHSNPLFASEGRDIRRLSESSGSKHGTFKAVNF